MSPKTRLDAVVRLRELDEDRARLSLAEAQRLALATAAAVHAAAERARNDERRSGCAADWTLVEGAHIRALLDARQAEQDKQAADKKLGLSREHFANARSRAESLRRVREARRSELQVAERLSEHKTMDEVGSMLRARR